MITTAPIPVRTTADGRCALHVQSAGFCLVCTHRPGCDFLRPSAASESRPRAPLPR